MNAAQIEIGGVTYAVGKLPARRQFHVARRLGPVIWTLLISSLGALRQALPEGGETTLKNVVDKLDTNAFKGVAAGSIGPLLGVLSTMSDEDSDYVITECLSVVQRQSGGSWAPVQNADGQLMFADIDMPIMMQLVFAGLRENLQNFTSALVLPV